MTWLGKKVRNSDGRTGLIKSDFEGFMHRGLFIQCDDGSKAHVQLNADGADSGERGWEWYCEGYDPSLGGPKWLTLGDHNDSASKPETGFRTRQMNEAVKALSKPVGTMHRP